MKKFSLSLILLLSSIASFSQSYMIPDAGGPGMEVYIEIVAPTNQKGFFGNDGFFINNSSEINRIDVTGGSSEFIEISPFVVSWEGRLISAYIYVDNEANPDSERYDILSSQFINQIEVYINNSLIESYDFHIIRPSSVGNITTGTLLGRIEGVNNGIGYVSPRNTIVVDSLTLANNSYDISIDDPDPNTSGNQAYLPFIILSDGPIIGLGPDSEINASANGKNAGPGGGGGAGGICDRSFFVSAGPGSNGGVGFTGGGAGGQNNNGSPNLTRVGGMGSGSDFDNNFNKNGTEFRTGGISLNGVHGGGLATNTIQSSGGGTGHPFGVSSLGYNNDGANGYGQGQYGGGAGNRGNRSGGNAGYGSAGVNDDTFPNGTNAGLAHGNDFGVPIAGGSGGGSGNPQSITPNCSGDGGGGGGAIRIFASSIDNIKILADGADGADVDPDGGSGSGGFIEISTKVSTTGVQYSANPGQDAGIGRYRHNVFGTDKPILISGTESPTIFDGMSTDSVQYVESSHNLSGRKRGGFSYEYFLKSKTGDWLKIQDLDGFTPQSFNFDINFDPSISKWYGASFLKINSPDQSNEYSYEPDYILSQSAANIFNLVAPEIECELSRNLIKLDCAESSIYDTLEISNLGEADLVIDLPNLNWLPLGASASIVSPPQNLEFIIAPGSSSFLITQFDIIPGVASPVVYTLRLPNNDSDENPTEITYSIDLVDQAVEINDSNGNPVSVINLDVCKEDFPYYFEIFEVVNLSNVNLTNPSALSNSNDFIVSLDTPDFPIRLTAQMLNQEMEVGTYSTTITFSSDECIDPLYSFEININVLDTELTLLEAPNNIFDFGSVKIGDSDTKTLTFRNTGATSIELETLTNITLPFNLISTTPALPITLAPNDEIILEIEFIPTVDGLSSQFHLFEYGDNLFVCDEQKQFELRGEGTQSDLKFDNLIDFGSHEYCYFPEQFQLFIENTGNGSYQFTEEPVFSGPNADLFNLNGIVPVDRRINPNSFAQVTISMGIDNTILPKGPISAIMTLKTDDPNLPIIEVDIVANIIDMAFSISLNQVNLGQIPYGIVQDINLDVTNQSNTFGLEYLRTEPTSFINTDPGNLIDPTEITSLIWEYIPPQGQFNESMTFWMESDFENCEYPVVVNILGEGAEQKVEFSREEFDFGDLIICDDVKTLALEVSLDGPGDVFINEVNLNNNIDGYFTTLNNPLPITINSNTFSITVFYDNIMAEYGNHEAELEILYTKNGETLNKVFTIKANKIRV
ncbi:choice-of-anchor D domain-containing protein, partial [Candidatus Kapabacteria bacterium]|nr:choice-of-anchor D domain-containing protein [Candidatus Kapabacteria bacterium]